MRLCAVCLHRGEVVDAVWLLCVANIRWQDEDGIHPWGAVWVCAAHAQGWDGAPGKIEALVKGAG